MAVLPDGLSTLVEVGIRHSPGGDLSKDWYTTYQFVKTGDDFTPAQAAVLVSEITAYEKVFHFNVVTFHGGYVRRYVPKTVEPNPDPYVYNASNHVPVALQLTGLRASVGLEVLPASVVVDFIRAGTSGNPGRVEFRGIVHETDVTHSISGKQLVDGVTFNDYFTDFFTAVSGTAAAMNAVMVLMGEPRISIVRTVVDNVLRTLKTYGPTAVRTVATVALGAIRDDKNNARWFNNPS